MVSSVSIALMARHAMEFIHLASCPAAGKLFQQDLLSFQFLQEDQVPRAVLTGQRSPPDPFSELFTGLFQKLSEQN